MTKYIYALVLIYLGVHTAFAQPRSAEQSDPQNTTESAPKIPKPGTLKPLTKEEEAQKKRWYQAPVSSVGKGDREAIAGQGTLRPMVQAETMSEYSKEALQARTQGVVRVGLTVNEQGMPENIVVLDGLDHGLNEKAMEAARKWRWRPGYSNGQKTRYNATIEFNFKLVGRTPDTTSVKASYELPAQVPAAPKSASTMPTPTN
jgi:TonB family protein